MYFSTFHQKMLHIVCCKLRMLKLVLQSIINKKLKKEILIQFGKNVRTLRLQQGLSQEQLAFKASLHRTYIGMIERAERNITLVNIEKLANALNISISELLNF